MKQNMSTADRIVRIIFAILISFLYITEQITGGAALILGALAVIFLFTGAIGSCPIYSGLKLSTKRAGKSV